MTPIDPANPGLKELLAKLGRNLLIFQQIETGLKFLLPLMHPGGSAAGLDAYHSLKQEIEKSTLGGLRVKVLESIETSHPEFFQERLAMVVNSRNDLAHHFWSRFGAKLLTEEGLREGVVYLDQQLAEVEPFHELVLGLGKGVATQIFAEYGEPPVKS